jgi:NAD(P)-dependent dehydrogenase (short-subunit alcohol dehydrogenase family)
MSADRLERKTRPASYIAVAAGLAAFGIVALAKKKPKHSFEGNAVLITGGSRGLGLILARDLVKEGARVAIAARDQEEIARALNDLAGIGGEVTGILCDVRSREDATRAVEECVKRFGSIDCLINDAGIIQTGPLEAQTEEDFRDAMDTHFWGPYYTMQAAVEHMRSKRSGRIVNISSIGGKVAVPHLAPYCASKFALSGLSSAMNVELAKDGIVVTTVYPGLMRTGSHINAEFKGQNKKEFALFSIVDALPISSINAERAAAKILQASREGKAELIISVQAKAAAKFNALFPEAMSTILATTNGLLPNAGENGTAKFKGLESTSALSPSILTAHIDEASRENNELESPTAVVSSPVS